MKAVHLPSQWRASHLLEKAYSLPTSRRKPHLTTYQLLAIQTLCGVQRAASFIHILARLPLTFTTYLISLLCQTFWSLTSCEHPTSSGFSSGGGCVLLWGNQIWNLSIASSPRPVGVVPLQYFHTNQYGPNPMSYFYPYPYKGLLQLQGEGIENLLPTKWNTASNAIRHHVSRRSAFLPEIQQAWNDSDIIVKMPFQLLW